MSNPFWKSSAMNKYVIHLRWGVDLLTVLEGDVSRSTPRYQAEVSTNEAHALEVGTHRAHTRKISTLWSWNFSCVGFVLANFSLGHLRCITYIVQLRAKALGEFAGDPPPFGMWRYISKHTVYLTTCLYSFCLLPIGVGIWIEFYWYQYNRYQFSQCSTPST